MLNSSVLWISLTQPKSAQVVTSLLISYKPISGYVRMACDSLLQQVCCKLSTDLLQVVNWLVASCQQTCCKLIISTGMLQVVSTSCNKSANGKLQQADKIDNLQQVCGVFCLRRLPVLSEFISIGPSSYGREPTKELLKRLHDICYSY